MFAYLRRFTRLGAGARRLLAASFLFGLAMGVTNVVFNLFLLAAGFDTAWIGMYVAVSSLVGVAAALPAGRLVDRVGGRRVIVAGGLVAAVLQAGQALWPAPLPLLGLGIASALAGTGVWIAVAPLMAEQSAAEERDLLFGAQFAVQTAAHAAGSLLGGLLPGLAGRALAVPVDGVVAYRATLLAGALLGAVAVAPIAGLAAGRAAGGAPRVGRGGEQPGGDAREPGGGRERALLVRFALPALLGGLGAGLFIPLQNVFFAQRFGASAAQIGLIFAWSDAAIAISALAAPALAGRLGRVRAVAAVQLASIPFLVAMAVVPGLWWAAAASLVRAALMNMANPLSTAFMMDRFPGGWRATASSVSNMAWTLTWSVGAQAGGLIMDRVSLTLPPWLTAVLYAAAALLYLRLFAADDPRPRRPRGGLAPAAHA